MSYDFWESIGIKAKEFPKITDSQARNMYVMQEAKHCLSYRGRVDLESHTGWEIMITVLPNGKVAVGIDRKGFFVFASILAITNENPEKVAPYIQDKLHLAEPDALLMAHFFKHFFSDGGGS